MVLNITEAALSLVYRSRSTLQRLVHDGQLDAYRVPSRGRQILLKQSRLAYQASARRCKR